MQKRAKTQKCKKIKNTKTQKERNMQKGQKNALARQLLVLRTCLYNTDHKNGFGCPELVNLNKHRPDTSLILFPTKQK